jgi:lactate dehydrogenase-like 2-hydroxyacid dehydrogenase
MTKSKTNGAVPTDVSDEEIGKFRLGIVGHGFVGQAVDYAFTHPQLTKFYT